jgi:endo-1,4-beta-xylanase
VEWIRDFGNRYSPDLVDVVNEPLHHKPSYRNALGGDGSSGWDWVVEAFRLANQYVSGTKILNEYDILNSSSNPSQLIRIADAIKNANLSVAIGCQAHSIENVSANDLRSRLDQIKNAGYSVYVSELDIRGSDSEQLRIYQDLFPILWEKSAGVTLWGYLQSHMWRGEAYLVTSAGSMRPAMNWLMNNYGPGGGGSTTTSGGYTTTTTSGGWSTTTTSGDTWWGGGSWWGSTTTTSGYTTTTTALYTTTTAASTTTTSGSSWWGGGSWWGSTTTTSGYTTTTTSGYTTTTAAGTTTTASSWWGGGSWW